MKKTKDVLQIAVAFIIVEIVVAHPLTAKGVSNIEEGQTQK